MADNPILDALAGKRGWSEEDKERFAGFAKAVAQTESKSDPKAYQYKGGPGRGKYQFEVASGKGSGTNKVAIQRYKNFLKQYEVEDTLSKEDWEELSRPDPDFARISETAQDSIFFAHHAMHPKHPVSKVAKGELDYEDAWLEYHWAGGDDPIVRAKRRAHFRLANFF